MTEDYPEPNAGLDYSDIGVALLIIGVVLLPLIAIAYWLLSGTLFWIITAALTSITLGFCLIGIFR